MAAYICMHNNISHNKEGLLKKNEKRFKLKEILVGEIIGFSNIVKHQTSIEVAFH